MSHLHHKVSALIDGELNPGARRRALAHVRGCDQCRQELAETLEVKQRLTRLAPVEVSADLLDIVAGLSPLPVVDDIPQDSPTRFRRVLVGMGSVSAVVVVLAYAVGAPAVAPAAAVRPPVEELSAEFADSAGVGPLADPAVGGLEGVPVAEGVQNATFDLESGAAKPAPLGGPRRSGPAPVPPHVEVDQPEAVLELRRAVRAPRDTSFVGTRVITSFTATGSATVGVKVKHVPGQGTRFDVLDRGGRVAARSFVGADSEPGTTLDETTLGALLDWYDVTIEGSQPVDGRATTVIAASRHGALTARFWIDDATGLLLRKAIYADGRLVRWSGYTAIRITHHAFMQHLPPELRTPNVTVLSKAVAPALNDKGWACPNRLGSRFELSYVHQIDFAESMVHAEYTDGVSTLSVFEQRGALDPSGLAGFRVSQSAGHPTYLRAGLPVIAVWESSGTVFTLVTDAPQQLVGGLVASLPHEEAQPSSGVTARVGHGLSRLVSAVSP